GGNGPLTIREVKTGAPVRTLGDSYSLSVAVAYSPDGKRVAWGGYSGVIGVADPITGEDVVNRQTPPSLTGLALSPDCTRLAAAAEQFGPDLAVWDLAGNLRPSVAAGL